jgi:hypothetical protein
MRLRGSIIRPRSYTGSPAFAGDDGRAAVMLSGLSRTQLSRGRIKLVPQTGLEPVTPSLRMTCSTN